MHEGTLQPEIIATRILKTFFSQPEVTGPQSSTAVEDAVDNRGLYRVVVSRLFLRGGFDTMAPQSRG